MLGPTFFFVFLAVVKIYPKTRVYFSRPLYYVVYEIQVAIKNKAPKLAPVGPIGFLKRLGFRVYLEGRGDLVSR